MGAPQIIYICLTSISLQYAAYKHGEPKEDCYDIWVSLISSAIMISILYWGGFFG